jgi:hypothetical protein
VRAREVRQKSFEFEFMTDLDLCLGGSFPASSAKTGSGLGDIAKLIVQNNMLQPQERPSTVEPLLLSC